MTDAASPATKLFNNLSGASARHARFTLATTIPRQWQKDDPDVSPEDRFAAAAEQVRRLDPQDPLEAQFAIFIVSAVAHGMDSLRLAVVHEADLPKVLRCRTQAASMMRQALNALRTLRPQLLATWKLHGRPPPRRAHDPPAAAA